MAKGVRKLTGFLWALLIAVLSFFIIFIFFPEASNRFFGVSVKGEDVKRIVKEVGDTVTEKVSNAVDKTIDKVSDTVVDVVTDKAPEIAEAAVESVAESLKKSGIQGK